LLIRPRAFFAERPRQGSLLGPLIFAAACIEAATLLAELLAMAGVPGVPVVWPFHQTVVAPDVAPGRQTPAGLLLSALVAPLAGVLLVTAVAAAGHRMLRLVAGPRTAGFRATFRVAAYSTVAALGVWLPYIGPAFLLHAVAVAVAGVRELHRLPPTRAAAAVVVPIGLLIGVVGVMQVVAAVALLVFNVG
ncbi:MAG: YIP1 family protein, partial [Sphaerobacter sp.]|nr:YIP1 family protein [Sphaerobacter sp.]